MPKQTNYNIILVRRKNIKEVYTFIRLILRNCKTIKRINIFFAIYFKFCSKSLIDPILLFLFLLRKQQKKVSLFEPQPRFFEIIKSVIYGWCIWYANNPAVWVGRCNPSCICPNSWWNSFCLNWNFYHGSSISL